MFKGLLRKNNKNVVTLLNKNIDWVRIVRNSKIIVLSSLLITSLIMLIAFEWNIIVLLSIFSLIIIATKRCFDSLTRYVKEKFYYRDKLLYFILNNDLFEEVTERYIKSNGASETKRVIVKSAYLSWEVTDTELIIYAYKLGDKLTKKMTELKNLSALFNLPLEEKIDRPSYTEYHFQTRRPERLYVSHTSKKLVNNSLEIPLGYGVTYNPVKCPHILISGGTGSGKSILISYLLIEFLKQESEIYICDPKNADLGALSYYLGDRVASSPNHIARVTRQVVEEMNNRYAHMNMKENFKYASSFVDHNNYKSIWLIFDEIGAFVATGSDKKSKEVVNEVMDYLTQIILLGRQAGVFVLASSQQMNSEVLGTSVRDQLGLRIALGANSSEGYRMVFGSHVPEITPPIEVKGSGLLYQMGSGKESAQYWESPFLDLESFNFIEELKKYI